MDQSTNPSIRCSTHRGCRIILWAFVVIPFLINAALNTTVTDKDRNFFFIPRFIFMISVAIFTVHCLGLYFKMGNILYVCMETVTVIVASYVSLSSLWTQVETTGYMILHLLSYLLYYTKGEHLEKDTVQKMQFLTTTVLAFTLFSWAVCSATYHRKQKNIVRFLSVVKVMFINRKNHWSERPCTERINAPMGPGRNPVIDIHPASTLDICYSTTTLEDTGFKSDGSSSTSDSLDSYLGSVLDYLSSNAA